MPDNPVDPVAARDAARAALAYIIHRQWVIPQGADRRLAEAHLTEAIAAVLGVERERAARTADDVAEGERVLASSAGAQNDKRDQQTHQFGAAVARSIASAIREGGRG